MIVFRKCFYHFVKFVIRFYLLLTHYSWKRYKPKAKNYLILTNHVTNWDFFLTGMCFSKHMYFVASEHILRNNFTGRLIKFLVDPIPRKKGASGAEASKAIIERLNKGFNVCMAVEGSRCFNGETGTISPATAKLVKDSKTALITCAFHGGYLINPRWSNEKRKGPYWGSVVREYSPEEIAAMTDEELNEQIHKDISVNAFEDQKAKMAKYTCKHPAEHLERALYICPKCHGFSTLQSKDDRFFCTSCGLDLKFNQHGFFESNTTDKVQFDNVYDWDKWQTSYLVEKLKEYDNPDQIIFFDENQVLFEVKDGNKTFIAKGRMSLYCDRLEICGLVYKFEDLPKFSLSMSDNILFTTSEGKYYEVRTEKPRSALRYLMALRSFQGKSMILR